MFEKAHAKVNLGLSVLGRREDGYHEIDTLFARLELHDEVRLEPRAHGVELEVRGADLPAGRGNLAYEAAQGYLEAAGAAGGVLIRLDKRIPVAAGLGGGSSDAAAVLRGLARLYPARYDPARHDPVGVDLLTLGRALGADVPFFVRDLPAARARGVGERLSPLALPPLHLVLVNPGVAVSAGDAYGWLTGLGLPLELERLVPSLAAEPVYSNGLQPGVVAREPFIAQALAAVAEAGLRGPLMSGSGATCFGLAQDAAHAEGVAADLQRRHPQWWVRATRAA